MKNYIIRKISTWLKEPLENQTERFFLNSKKPLSRKNPARIMLSSIQFNLSAHALPFGEEGAAYTIFSGNYSSLLVNLVYNFFGKTKIKHTIKGFVKLEGDVFWLLKMKVC